MDYRIIINEEKLSDILSMLSAFCKGKIRFYDNTTLTYKSKGRENTPFCSILSRAPASNLLCTKCNENANNRCRKRRSTYAYHCHAGLVEIISPIYYEGIYIGHIGIGQFRDTKDSPDPQYMSWLSELSGKDINRLKKTYTSQPMINSEGIKGASMLLEMTVRKLCEENVFSIDYHNTIVRVEQYIRDHINSNLTLADIASHVYMNPSYLSSMYHKATGNTLSHFIQQERVAQAIYYFSISAMSISEVASAVGFRDANYFTKVFRKETGYTPRDYRHKLTTGEIIY